MKAKSLSKVPNLRVLYLLILIICVSSCKKNNPIENTLKTDAFTKNEKEEIETFFFIATANVSKTIISKSQIAQQKCSNVEILKLTNRIELHQKHVLNEVTRIANTKLIIITEVNAKHKIDLHELMDLRDDNFQNAYLQSMAESLNEQIELFESISKESTDKTILRLVLKYLPEQYTLLRETERINKEIK